MPGIAYQLYCSRNFPPLAQTCQMLRTAGYDMVEGYGALFSDTPTLEAALKDSGLSMPTAHMGLDLLEEDAQGTIDTAKRLGIETVIVPYLAAEDRPTDAAGWQAFGDRLADAAKPLEGAGLRVGWHNHDFEFHQLDDGRVAQELILGGSDSLLAELDIGWIIVAGHDPVDWIKRYDGRIAAAHIKDIAPDGQNADEDGWADVGHGVVDWAPILSALEKAGCRHLVVEHDNPSDDGRFARRSIEALNDMMGAMA